MKINKLMLTTLFSIFFIECTTAPIKGFVSEGHHIFPIKKVLIRVRPFFDTDVIDALKIELQKRGIKVVNVEGVEKVEPMLSTEADKIIWIDSKKRWDLGTYTYYMEIKFFDSKKGTLLGTGKWETRNWHGYRPTEVVVEDLIQTVFDQIQKLEQWLNGENFQ